MTSSREGLEMFSNVKLILAGIVAILVISLGLWIKSMYDDNIECKANTKILTADYKRDKKNYDRDVISIVSFYENESKEVDTFKGRKDETDCEASKRFFYSRSY